MELEASVTELVHFIVEANISRMDREINRHIQFHRLQDGYRCDRLKALEEDLNQLKRLLVQQRVQRLDQEAYSSEM